MTLVQLMMQDGYPGTGNNITLLAMLNLSGGVLPLGYGGYAVTRDLNRLLSILNNDPDSALSLHRT